MKKSERYFLFQNIRKINQGMSSNDLSQINRAINELKDYLKNNKSVKGALQLSYAYLMKGNVYYFKEKYSEATKYHNLSQEIFENSKVAMDDPRYSSDWFNYATLFKFKGIVEQKEGNFEKSFESFKREVDILEQLHSIYPNDTDVTDSLLGELQYLARFSSDINLFKEAIEYAEKYLDLYGPVADPMDKDYKFGLVYTNIGQNYINLGDNAKGREYLNKALAIFQKLLKHHYSPEEMYVLSVPLTEVYNSLGAISRDSGDYKTALKNFMTAKDFLKASSPKGLGEEETEMLDQEWLTTLLAIAETYGLMGKPRKMKRLLDHLGKKMLNLHESIKSGKARYSRTEDLIFCFERLNVDALSGLGDFTGAAELFIGYNNEIGQFVESGSRPSISLNSLIVDLEVTRLNLLIKLLDNLSDVNDGGELRQFISDTYALTKRFNEANPGVLDSEKITDLERKFAQLF